MDEPPVVNTPTPRSSLWKWIPKVVGGLVVMAAIAIVGYQFVHHPNEGGHHENAPQVEEPEVNKPGDDVDPNQKRSWKHILQAPTHVAHRKGKTTVRCRECHIIQGGTYDLPTPDRCVKCHLGLKPTVHARVEDKGAPMKCVVCHAFRLDETTGAPKAMACKDCHAKPQGDLPAIEIHGSEDCASCHKPHADPSLQPRPCTECHNDVNARHGDKPGGASLCLDCHHPHKPANIAGGRCLECHSKNKPQIPSTALFRGGHERCTGCHRPHGFTKESAHSCRSCHAKQYVLGANKVAQHAECTSCHSPHDVKAGARNACGRCHTKVSPQHPVDAKRGTCISCHPIHTNDAKMVGRKVLPCSTCHTQAKTDNGFHAGGLGCTDCHSPHAFGKPAPCADCHDDKAAATKGNPGHATCTRCHDKHKPKPAKAQCKSCHTTQAKTALAGMECTTCHENVHAGRAAAKADCGACHDEKKKEIHGNLSGGCANCHKPHGQKLPDCTKCHAASSLPGKHQQDGHDDCRACHKKPHERPKAERALCLECHTDKADHQKDKPRCDKCHIFKKTASGSP